MSERFLAFSYKPKPGGSGTRVALWRALKEAGATYLQQSIALLPSTKANRLRLEELKAEVVQRGGAASLSSLVFLSQEDEVATIGEFRRARREEYEELAANCEVFREEVERHAERGDYAFAEHQEGAAELAKLERWLARIESRDHFGGAGREAAEAALGSARRRFRTFERKACSSDSRDD
jgi:hypothetical protein